MGWKGMRNNGRDLKENEKKNLRVRERELRNEKLINGDERTRNEGSRDKGMGWKGMRDNGRDLKEKERKKWKC